MVTNLEKFLKRPVKLGVGNLGALTPRLARELGGRVGAKNDTESEILRISLIISSENSVLPVLR